MYVIIWEFRAKTGREADFERVYGPDGEWTELFKRGEALTEHEALLECWFQ